MKASDVIRLLQKVVEERGDLDVVFHGPYGATSGTFAILDEKDIAEEDRGKYINVWVDIMTG